MKKIIVVFCLLALVAVNAGFILPSSREAVLDLASDMAQDTHVQDHPYNANGNFLDATRSQRQFGGFGYGGSGSQAAANSFGGGYNLGGYPGGFGGSGFGYPGGLIGGGGGFGGLGGYGGFSGSSAQSSSNAFGAGGGLWG